MNSRQHETRQHGVGRTISLRSWPTIWIIVLVALVCVVGLGPGCRVSPGRAEGPTPSTQATAQATRQEGLTESDAIIVDRVTSQLCLPPTERRHFDLSKVRRLDEEKMMTGQQRLNALLGYLKEEIGNPTTPGLGIGGGPIDSGYGQGVIVQVIGQTVAAEDLVAARTQETNPAFQERLTVALGITGDKSMIPHLIPILAHHPEGFLRQKAAIALADFKESSLEPAFNGALKDRYSRVRISGIGGGGHF